MPKPIVSLRQSYDNSSWVITWWRHNGSCLCDTKTFPNQKIADLAAREFAEQHRMAYLPPGFKFLSVQKKGDQWALFEVKFEGKPNYFGISRSTKEEIEEEGLRIAVEGEIMFIPEFLGS